MEEAQKARLEARAARESMRQFKEEYGKRFATLKAALEKFRKQYPEPSPTLHPPQPQQLQQQSGGKDANTENPILGSNFVKSSLDADVKKREQVIRKLASDLKKEKEESKKKDAALRRTSVAREKEIVVVMMIVRMVLFVVKITVKEKRLIRRMIAV